MSDPMPGRPSDFIVRLEGVKLDDAGRRRLSNAIQNAVMSELGLIDLNPKGNWGVHIPKEWLGRWLRQVENLNDLQGLGNKALNVHER
jgi:hypothetical protein